MSVQISANVSPEAKADILELQDKIEKFKQGSINEDSFKSYRLARGIYGQRQPGVNMIRIKLPFGRFSATQLIRMAKVAQQYGNGILHMTTRQDIQLHYAKLNETPQLWADLEDEQITLREACGNTVRNLTASPYAGIDPDEAFDVTPYAKSTTYYFMRNPVCQSMGRKFKIAFSSSDKDSAYAFIHDLGFIPRIKKLENGSIERGFKVLVAGGLGAQPFEAQFANAFLSTKDLIPFIEACLRVFDRYGERAKRNKARLKYLIKEIGAETYLKLVQSEMKAINPKAYSQNFEEEVYIEPTIRTISSEIPNDQYKYAQWKKMNIFNQKQSDFVAVQIKLTTGDLDFAKAEKLATIIKSYTDEDDIRVTVNQGLLLRFVRATHLPNIFNALNSIGLAEPGFDNALDIVACPGTDTCNLGIASSIGLAHALEKKIIAEYSQYPEIQNLKIKISGCMNGCGHHTIANIGFHGMSMKIGQYILPAMQVLLGGGFDGEGRSHMGEKIIKLPAKLIPNALDILLHDYIDNRGEYDNYNDYYYSKDKNEFYLLLKSIGEIKEATPEMAIDWDTEVPYKPEIGVGECAAPMMDMVGVILSELEEVKNKAIHELENNNWAESIFYSNNIIINSAKALLLTKQIPCNSNMKVINNFDENFVNDENWDYSQSFADFALAINKEFPTEQFANNYYLQAIDFYSKAKSYRSKQLVRN